MKITNTSHWDTDLVTRLLRFTGHRIPAKLRVTIWQGSGTFSSGHGGHAIFVRANVQHRRLCDWRDHRGYLAYRAYGGLEELAFVLFHEWRHVWQRRNPLPREARRIRRLRLGTCAKLREVDAQLFAIRTLRRFRREWPASTRAVLPLP